MPEISCIGIPPIIFQDNDITIRMANNGRDSYTGNFRHIKIRDLFVKDKVDKEEIDIKYYLSHLMIADYFTKPQHGKIFKMFINLIMGYVHINDILQEIELSAKEPAEKSKNVTVNSITNNRKYAMLTFAKSKKEGLKKKMKENIY